MEASDGISLSQAFLQLKTLSCYKIFDIICSDIDQLKRIMEVVGTPTPDVLKKISSEHVRRDQVFNLLLLTMSNVLDGGQIDDVWYYPSRLRSTSSLFHTCLSRTWRRYLEEQIHRVRLKAFSH